MAAKIAPGVGHSVWPTADVWDVKGLNQNEIMRDTMIWKESFKEKIPKRRMPHRFLLNKLKSA